MNSAFPLLLEECFRLLSVPATLGSDQSVRLDFSQLATRSWKWKCEAFSLSKLTPLLASLPQARIDGETLTLTPKTLSSEERAKLYDACLKLAETLLQDNLARTEAWGQIDVRAHTPTGFTESEPGVSQGILERLYADRYIVKEKKGFIVDLHRSQGPYLVSIGPDRKSFLDGSAQIASLSLGYNDPAKKSLSLRSELFSAHPPDWKNWDIYQAFTGLLKRESGFKECAISNSGAEAMEVALRAMQTCYPSRRKLIAFEGSFHGRSVLSLHSTHSPSKRTPFEIHPSPELVEFVPFPEQKNIYETALEPSGWISAWSHPKGPQFDQDLQKWLNSKNSLLAAEARSLARVREICLKERPLAVLLEPMQCEGGDRHGTPRFFRALRLLTRALDTALVFDEVQTGLGLGGGFFWHKCFTLVDHLGNPDLPDAVVMAKKTQVGVTLSNVAQDLPIETSAASMYRGYLQALSIFDWDPKPMQTLVRKHLNTLQNFLGPSLIANPRSRGLSFSIDLPSADITNKLIAQRFPAGTLFYPAGDQTARFRLFSVSEARHVHQLFIAIYKCFESLARTGVIPALPPIEKWAERCGVEVAPEMPKLVSEKPGVELQLPWKSVHIPKNKQEFLQISSAQYQDIFHALFNECPEILHSPSSLEWDLHRLSKVSAEELWNHYLTHPEFTMRDLLWTASRAFGSRIARLTHEQVGEIRPKIKVLEETLYEPARQDDPEMFYRVSEDPNCIFLASFGPKGELAGICAAAPMQHFANVALVSADPNFKVPSALYGIDLSVHPDFQGHGLGLRFKCEQYLEALRQGATLIRSRNRFPEASGMIHINRKLSSVVVSENSHDYEGDGLSLYQSIELRKPARPAPSVYSGGLRNKGSLANFVSPGYVNNLLFLKDFLPKPLRHLYLASGRAESTDKALKLLRAKRPKAKIALSFQGDYFGHTTACARSLGGVGGDAYFDWPRLTLTEGAAGVEKLLQKLDPETVFGFFVEPIAERTGVRKDEDLLKSLISVCHSKGIPVLFHETASAFYKYDSKRFTAAGEELEADGAFLYAGAQLGLVLTRDTLFLETALAMISTWDGDEHSLNLLRERLLRSGRC
jgi:4-aminobutyrate aminotransferase-like enzyme